MNQILIGLIVAMGLGGWFLYNQNITLNILNNFHYISLALKIIFNFHEYLLIILSVKK